MRLRVARSHELVAQGRPAAVVARVAGISRQAIYRRPKRPPAGQRLPRGAIDRVVLAVARANPTDGTRMVAALASRQVGEPVNRKRVQRLMREHRLRQRQRSQDRRRRPGYFRVARPDQLWHMDMTNVWVAEHGWCYLNAAIDCCTREICGWALDIRCRAPEAIAVIEAAAVQRGIAPGALTLGTDNGSALTSRKFRARLSELAITHRRGGYRDPESQAFIESWFSKLKLRCIWREEFETLEQARAAKGRLHRPLPPPTPQPAGLPHPTRGRPHLAGSRRTANPRGLTVNAHRVHVSSGAGKTTVSRMLAGRFGCRLYPSDATIRVHSSRLAPAEAPLLDAFPHAAMDERWVQRDPATMARTFPWFQGEGFDMIAEDLRRLPNLRVVLVEGFRLPVWSNRSFRIIVMPRC